MEGQMGRPAARVRQGEADGLKGQGPSPKDTFRLENLRLWEILLWSAELRVKSHLLP